MTSKRAKKSGVPGLTDFLRNNPWSKIERRSGRIDVVLPWNDSTVILSVSKKEQPFLPLINKLLLPERFNAIFHLNQGRLEFIFNSLFDKKEPFPSRPFEFRFRGKTFACSYSDPSPEVLFLARVYRQVQAGVDSDFRNLDDLQDLQEAKNFPRELRSFWQNKKGVTFSITGIEKYEEDFAVLLAKHLNFYTECPRLR